MRSMSNILVTGGAGFIASNFIRHLFTNTDGFNGNIINVDSLTYAGCLENLNDIESRLGAKRYFFEYGNICDASFIESIFKKYEIDMVVHFAAESHVDRSILGPRAFIETNVLGTQILLDAARNFWKPSKDNPCSDYLFHHISTDEVYGSLGNEGYFCESTPYNPRSPYSASKAASDHLVMSYYHTYGLPVTLSNCSNNYGPYQFPEKFIPLMIINMLEGKPLPIYGTGKNVRDWIHVADHSQAVYLILSNGKTGEKYNIGGDNEWQNEELVHTLIEIVGKRAHIDKEKLFNSITYIKDRPGHDFRYAIDCSKIKRDLGWRCLFDFHSGLEQTVDWYINNKDWTDRIRSGEYR